MSKSKVLYSPRGRASEYGSYAINIYKGCTHGCLYCYAKRFSGAFFHAAYPKDNVLERIERDLSVFKNKDKPIVLSFMGDVYQPYEMQSKLMRETLILLRKYGCKVSILTKGGDRSKRDFDIISSMDAWYGATLTFISESDSKHY